jgi:1-acyl-sn-glycerol-3-phosphate acyltransferase
MMTVESVQKKNRTGEWRGYNHAEHERMRKFLRSLIRWIGFTLLAKIDRIDGVENVPAEGPAILMMNHLAFVDSLFVLHSVPRNIVPLAKVEVYDYPVIGIFPRLWHVIPVRREEVDRRAIQMTLEVLKAGEMVLVAPEGTRGTELREGKVGIAYLASRSGAPIVPVAIGGTPGFPALRGTAPWRGPGARVCYGKPFRFRQEYSRAGKEGLRQMTDEAMYILAAMLPEERRGYYADLSQATRETIEL